MKLADAVNRVIAQYGNPRKAGEALSMCPTYLWRLAKGDKSNPKDEQLTRLGLKRVVTYEFINDTPPLTRAEYRDGFKAIPVERSTAKEPCEGCAAAVDPTGRMCDTIHGVQALNCVTDKIIWVKK